jgi:DNA-binding XRE family transcriptional regulator
MGTRPHAPQTRLGQDLRQRRGDLSQDVVAAEIGIPAATLSRVERGTHTLSLSTARALAAWLGWTLEQVLEAAETPATS